jgi:hypothetical protein
MGWPFQEEPFMASTDISSSQSMPVKEQVQTEKPSNPKRSGSRLTSFWKALIITSFLINAILIIILLVLGGLVFQLRDQLLSTDHGLMGFARNNVAELRSVVDGLEGSTIRTTIPLDDVTIPLALDVPVNQVTEVELTEAASVTVENADIDLGLAGRLRATVNLQLPVGTKLKIRLNMNIPINQSLPLKDKGVTVPVEIPLAGTELGPQFRRLGELVDRLAGPAAPLLGLDIPPAPPAPPAPTATPK